MVKSYGKRNNSEFIKRRIIGSKIRLENKYNTYLKKHTFDIGLYVGLGLDKSLFILTKGKSAFLPFSFGIVLKGKIKVNWYSDKHNFINSLFYVRNNLVFDDNLYSKIKKSSKMTLKSFYTKISRKYTFIGKKIVYC